MLHPGLFTSGQTTNQINQKRVHSSFGQIFAKPAFETLKEAFTMAPILIHFDFDKEILVVTDASDIPSASILS